MSATTRGDLHGLFDDLPPLRSRAPASAATAPSDPARARPGRGPGRHRRRSDHALLPDVPRALVPRRRRRLLPVAPGRWAAPTRTITTRCRARARSWTTEPMRRCTPHPPSRDRRCDRIGGRNRTGSAASALHGALRRLSPRRTSSAELAALLRPLDRPSRAGDPGPGRARPHVARDHARPRRRPARRHARSGCSAGATRGPSTRSSTSCAPPSPSWRSRRSRC